MEKNLSGLGALVTGAGRGIGRAIAVRLSAGGCRVVCADIDAKSAGQTAELIGEGAMALRADVSLPADVDRMMAETAAALGGLDVLVNNAGVSTAGFIESVTEEEMARVFGVNMFGVMRVTRAASPLLRKSGRGRIINVSSVEGIRGSGLLPVYSSTKAGVIGLTRANAVEFARFGVTVNAVCPGPIQTEMLASVLADERFREKAVRGVPMRRLGTPEDVAGAVAFFASAEASYITGNILVIDGGMTVKAL